MSPARAWERAGAGCRAHQEKLRLQERAVRRIAAAELDGYRRAYGWSR